MDSEVRGFTTIDETAYKNMENSDVIIVTAGLARKPGMSRDDLLEKNVQIISSVAKNVKKYSPNSNIVIVSNPADTISPPPNLVLLTISSIFSLDNRFEIGIIMKKMKDKGFVTLSYIDLKQILENNFQEKFKTYYIMNVCKRIRLYYLRR